MKGGTRSEPRGQRVEQQLPLEVATPALYCSLPGVHKHLRIGASPGLLIWPCTILQAYLCA